MHSKERRTGEYIACIICGKTVYRKPSRVRKENYCSQSCAGKASKIAGLNKKLTDEQIVEAVKKYGTANKAAKGLGVYPSTIYRRIKKIGDAI